MTMSLDELIAASKPTSESLKAVSDAQITPASVQTPNPFPTASIPTPGFQASKFSAIGGAIMQAQLGQAGSQISQGVGEVKNSGGNPLEIGSGALNTVAGLINGASALIPSYTIPASLPFMGAQAVADKSGIADKLANTKPFQEYGLGESNTPADQQTTAERITTAIQNGANIAGALAGFFKSEDINTPSHSIPSLPNTDTGIAANGEVGMQPLPVPEKPQEAITPRSSEIAPSSPEPTTNIGKAQAEHPLAEEAQKYKTGKTTQTLKPIEGTGPIKTRGLSENVEASAIEKKLTDNFGDLPEYRQLNMKDQALKVADLITKDPINARAIAMGEKAPPKGILPESVYVAAEHKATVEGDVQTLKELANSKLSASATTMGQRIRTLGERDQASPVAAIQEIQKARAESQAKRSESIPQTVERIKTAIRQTHTKQSWGDFITSIEC